MLVGATTRVILRDVVAGEIAATGVICATTPNINKMSKKTSKSNASKSDVVAFLSF
jgi:hypothetical protein